MKLSNTINTMLKKEATKLVSLCAVLLMATGASAQTNIALTATATHSGGGATTFGPAAYNDNVIPACGSQPWGWVSSNGWIEFTWSSAQTMTGVRFLKDNRPMTSCTIQYYNGSSYVNITSYSNGTTCDHTVNFTAVTGTRFRLLNIAGSSNPNFREIQIFGATCQNGLVGSTLTPTCSDQTISVGSGERRDINVVSGRPYRFTLTSCPTGWTMQLTGRNTSDVQQFQVSSTCTTTANWTATYTGVLRLNINRSNCQEYQGNNSAVLTYKQVPPSAGATTTWIGGTSGTNNWNVDSNWDNCIPTISINADIPNVGNQPGITTSAAARTLDISAGRVVTVACSNCLQIGP